MPVGRLRSRVAARRGSERAWIGSPSCACTDPPPLTPPYTLASPPSAAARLPAALQKFPQVQCFTMPHLVAVCISVVTSLLAMVR